MSSNDREVTGQAEMQPSKVTPVTAAPKSTGLNPNANVFHIKGPTAPLSPLEGGVPGSSDWPPTPETTPKAMDAAAPSTSESFSFMNGDTGTATSHAGGAGVEGSTPVPIPTTTTNFPPSPESPPTRVQQAAAGDHSHLNGSLEGQPLSTQGAEAGQEDSSPSERNLADDELRTLLKSQLEYYFSRENLANDSYLVSQMDADKYVSIATIAKFNQVKKLTSDLGLVIEVLRESAHVQVDEIGKRVRPLYNRCIVILREVPDTTPVEAIKKLFQGANCPPFVSCEFAHNDSWFVTFESEEEAHKAYRYLREEVCTFLGKPIMARIKAKPLLSSFTAKNGFKQGGGPGGFKGNVAGVYNQPQKFQFPAPVPPVPFIPNQQISSTAYPFFPPSVPTQVTAAVSPASIPQLWSAPAPPQLTLFDPGTAFAANGYTPSSAIKLPQSTNRHGFQNMRNSRSQKSQRGSSSGRDSVSGQSDHSERPGLESDLPEPDPRERLAGSAAPYPQRERSERSSYHERHMGSMRGGGGGGRSDWPMSGGGGSSHHYPHHNTGGLRHHEGGGGGPGGSGGGRGGHHQHSSHHPHHHHHNHGGSGPTPHPHSHSYPPHSHFPPSMDHERSGLSKDRSERGNNRGDGLLGSASVGSRHSSLSDATSNKETFSQSLPPRRGGGSYRGRRRPRHEDIGANRPSSTSSSQSSAVKEKPPATSDPPNFDLADTSFPPLPGSLNNASSNEVFESKMSDVVKGTAKPSKPVATVTTTPATTGSTSTTSVSSVKGTLCSEAVTSSAQTVVTASSSTAAPTQTVPLSSGATTAASSTMTSATTTLTTASCSTSLPTPPQSPQRVVKAESQAPATTVTAASTASVSVATVATPTSTRAPDSANASTQTCPVISTSTETVSSTTTSSNSTTSAKTASTQASTETPPSESTSEVQEDAKNTKKLSYAEMAQRGKEKAAPAGEKPKTEESVAKETVTTTSSAPCLASTIVAKDSVGAPIPSSNTQAAGPNGSGRRDDFREQRPFVNPRRPREFPRRDDRRDDRKDRNGRGDYEPRDGRGFGGGYLRDRDRRAPRDYERVRAK